MRPSILAFVLLFTTSTAVTAAEPIVRAGAGSYTTALPPGAKGPPETIRRTENLTGPMPTNDWWSSLAWTKFSEPHYPHPLAVQTTPNGLRIYSSGRITASRAGIFGAMPGKPGDDLVLGHSGQDEFTDARIDSFSDWFVTVRFAEGERRLLVSYGHGSPFVYATVGKGRPRLTFTREPTIWDGDEKSPVLGVTINGKHYGLFGPTGSAWTGIGSKVLTNQSDKDYFSLAVLPDNSRETLQLFKRHAHAHVRDTRVRWAYEPKTGTVRTTFTIETVNKEGDQAGTLFALYPHQWRNTQDKLLDKEYTSVRGKLKLGQGKSFTTTMKFPGVLPCLPSTGRVQRETMTTLLAAELKEPEPPIRDTYADGKWLGRLANLAVIAEQYQLTDAATRLRQRLRERLEHWFTATDDGGKLRPKGLFYLDQRWGTLIGYPASYGTDTELNDHHFHYGYFIRAAAEVARADRAWAGKDRFGDMVRLLIRDIASPDRRDPLFPFLRNFDPYAGHSWASGHARFGDGNNNESSSEAMNAWYGLILWAEVTDDPALRDLGVYLYTTEMHAIHEYWFDVHGENFPRDYPVPIVTMVWGGKGANATWFSAQPEHIHGINWLPIQGGSLYLGHHQAHARKNYEALLKARRGPNWEAWSDLIWMYRALTDPDDAIRQYETARPETAFENGNGRAQTYHWLYNLKQLGRIDPSTTADYPLTAVFRTDQGSTYCVHNLRPGRLTVTFSDGFEVRAEGGRLARVHRPR